MESLREAFRDNIAPHLSVSGLQALEKALVSDDPCLLQGQTMNPPPTTSVKGSDVNAACLIAYAGWRGEGLRSVWEVMNYFNRLTMKVPYCGDFLTWFDETPRHEMIRLLLPEVQRALSTREEPACGVSVRKV